MKSDAALLAAARTESGAFRELYDRYANRVLGYHLRRCRDDDAAHELTAETFAQAWLVRGRFRDECGGSAGPWLFGIARNVLLASVRRRALEAGARERLGMLAAPVAEPGESWLDGLDEALDELPESQREAIRLRVIDDLGYADGGCRSLRSDGTEWQCYIGRAAVDQEIIGAGFLGAYLPSPAVG